MFKKLAITLDLINEYIEGKLLDRKSKKEEAEINEKEENKLCPYFDKPCLGSECLAFMSNESEWNETELAENPDTGRVEELHTGRRLKGITGSCRMGVFKNVILEQNEVSNSGKSSSLLDIS